MSITRWFTDLDWRYLLLILLPFSLSLLAFLSVTTNTTIMNPFTPIKSFILSHSTPGSGYNSASPGQVEPELTRLSELTQSRIAVCLVGGARRFELTGPSIVKNVLDVYPNSDLFLHSPFDRDSFKLSLLKNVSRLASIRIFKPQRMNESDSQIQVLTARDSPNGIQGLIQYFNLVEGCLTMINQYQTQNNFTYDWVVRTRVDGYWNSPLEPENFVKGQYLVPPGSSYRGLNDRLGIGDLNSSIVALSRLSLIPQLQSAGFTELNSETAFKAQLTTQGVPYFTNRLPFCIISDRKYTFPPSRFGVPVTALSSPGPLSGAKCRPCTPVCQGPCVADVMGTLYKWWSWTNWGNGTLQLCDAHGPWETGWEKKFDETAGKKLAASRKRIKTMKMKECIENFVEMKRRTANWDVPDIMEVCRLGLITD
ncbi:hypothetical protein GIB67_038245 [Kingdonia uniflora]|uniref:DUF7796 domain-containing protein n=1 Tax=Kingdonia uniflora TaxID=39325 RepID=A0A7J7MSH1_9MAGN|nr:hypothetical protein GIB67_038245 [Kingdonia uniflora]